MDEELQSKDQESLRRSLAMANEARKRQGNRRRIPGAKWWMKKAKDAGERGTHASHSLPPGDRE